MSKLIDYNCFIFDMDGTLVNLEELNYQGYANTVKYFYDLELTNSEYQKHFSGARTAQGFTNFLGSQSISDFDPEVLVKHFRIQKRDNLRNNFANCVHLISGAGEYLSYLQIKGKTLVLATSTVKEFTEIILTKTGLAQFFNHILTAEDVSKGKPDPEIYHLALERCGCSSDTAVVFEDSKNGIRSAKSAGIYCVGIHTSGLNDKWVTEADEVIEGYNSFLRNMN